LEETSQSQDRTLNSLNAETKLVFALNMARMVGEVSDPETKAIIKAILNQLAMSLIKTDRMH
jgi:hypothetical protein